MADKIAKPLLVFVARRAKSQLTAKFFDDSPFAPQNLLLIDWLARAQTEVFSQFVAGRGIHADEKAAATLFIARQLLDIRLQEPPAAQVEVAGAEVRSIGRLHRASQRGEQLFRYVVKDSGHGKSFPGGRYDSAVATKRKCANTGVGFRGRPVAVGFKFVEAAQSQSRDCLAGGRAGQCGWLQPAARARRSTSMRSRSIKSTPICRKRSIISIGTQFSIKKSPSRFHQSKSRKVMSLPVAGTPT